MDVQVPPEAGCSKRPQMYSRRLLEALSDTSRSVLGLHFADSHIINLTQSFVFSELRLIYQYRIIVTEMIPTKIPSNCRYCMRLNDTPEDIKKPTDLED
jgi:hypothetical protein